MKDNVIKRLIRYIGRDRCTMIIVLISSVLSSLAYLLCPKIIGNAVDAMFDGTDNWAKTAFIYLGILLSLYLINAFLVWLTSLLANKVAIATTKRLRDEVFAKLARLPFKYFDRTPAGETISRATNDIEAINDGLANAIVQLVSGSASVLLALGFMISLNIKVALVAVFVTPLCFFTGFIITRYGKSKFSTQAKAVGAVNACANEMISSGNTVKSYCYEEQASKRFRSLNDELYNCGWKAQFASALVNPTTRFVNNTAYVLVGVFCIIAVINNDLTAGGITAFLSYTSQFSKPINEMTSITMQLQLATAGARRVFALLDMPEEVPDGNSKADNFEGNVSFRNVAFAYDPLRPLIKNFTVDVKKGTKVAIVGRTGAGKTTVVNLLMRFYDVDNGSICMDGVDIREIPRDALRRNIGMVLQETWLFSGTIRDNIAYGVPDATDEMIVEAAKKAHADGFISRLPNGYDTVIGSAEGGGLSAGQRQLIAISRVMLMNTPVMILDEATSNVDILTEKRIQKAFEELTKNRTSFVIAHRLSTIQDSDLILVMEKGDIAEQGTHEELLRKGGIYSTLYYSFDS